MQGGSKEIYHKLKRGKKKAQIHCVRESTNIARAYRMFASRKQLNVGIIKPFALSRGFKDSSFLSSILIAPT